MFFFQQKTAYEMRISDWSSDVCSSDLRFGGLGRGRGLRLYHRRRRVAGAGGRGGEARGLDRRGGRRLRCGRRRGADRDRKSGGEGKRVVGRGVLGGRRTM